MFVVSILYAMRLLRDHRNPIKLRSEALQTLQGYIKSGVSWGRSTGDKRKRVGCSTAGACIIRRGQFTIPLADRSIEYKKDFS